ncbi:MAG: tetratricopeptide repeat protein, partial [Pirellulaceae bacterium]|nr:tetratricopeptide repeat protein [Pirellulaceae bacterium]
MRRKRRAIRSTEHRGRSAYLSLRYVAIAAVLATGIAIVAVQGRWTTDQSVPRSPSIQELLDDATDYIDQGNFAAAEKILVSVLAQDADNGTAWLYRGQLARDRGNLDLALEAWRHVPNSPVKIGGTAR